MTVRWIEDAPEVLRVAEMYRADEAAIAAGVSGLSLMEAAGAAVAEIVDRVQPAGRIVILCGPGNNGGDGFVAARMLAAAGREVVLALLGDVAALKGDAAENAKRWDGGIVPLSPEVLDGAAVVVDALFGAGLTRPLDGMAQSVIEAVVASGVPCVAVDVPSGVDGDSGAVLGVAAQATATVTFFRRKPGHLLYPGRGLCGAVHIADIGTPESVLGEIAPATTENSPQLWRDVLPRLSAGDHKYTRGHAVVAGGAVLTGAARLACHAALRVGAGLASIASPPEAGDIYRAGRPTSMVRDIEDGGAFSAMLSDPRVTATLVGPGNGVTAQTRDYTLRALASGKPCVIDADAITIFADAPQDLLAALTVPDAGGAVLTPHDGEFARLFPDIAADMPGKLDRALAAAQRAGAVVLLKGPDTVIAAPDGRAAINANAPPYLATAGAGDVLAGFILGLVGQGMPLFAAACAGAWLHGAAAESFGPGLIADDLADALPDVLRKLYI